VLSKTAQALAELFAGRTELGASFNSPIKGAIKVVAGRFEDLVETIGIVGTAGAAVTIILGIVLIFLTLAFVTRNMKVLVAARIERSLNAALARSGLVGMVVGLIVTVAVQSSSITTSILIPLIAAGVLTVGNAFPITLGANVGTTITALLAALGAAKVDGLTIALVHTLFNLAGILIIYPWPRLRRVPIALAELLADIAMKHKTVVIAYLVGAFVLVPVGIVVVLG
jgi:sodium-dependent phosphate cotransporter